MEHMTITLSRTDLKMLHLRLYWNRSYWKACSIWTDVAPVCHIHCHQTGFFPSFHEQYRSYIFKLVVTCWAVCLLAQMKQHSPVWWAAQFNLLCSMFTWPLASCQGGLGVNKIWRWNVATATVFHISCSRHEIEYCQRNCDMFDGLLFFKSMKLFNRAEWERGDIGQENLTQVNQS